MKKITTHQNKLKCVFSQTKSHGRTTGCGFVVLVAAESCQMLCPIPIIDTESITTLLCGKNFVACKIGTVGCEGACCDPGTPRGDFRPIEFYLQINNLTRFDFFTYNKSKTSI